MRVAILTTSYPSRAGDPAGHFVRAEALELARAGHHVHVLAPAAGRPALDDDAVQLWPMPHGGVFGWPGAASRLRQSPWRAPGAAAFALRAADRLSSMQPDLIVAHWLVPSGAPIALRARSDAELECVAHGADVRLLCRVPAALRELVLRRLLDRASRIRFVAASLLHDLCASVPRELRLRVERVAVVQPCAIHLPDVSLRAAELRRTYGARHLLTTVGRLVPGKRVELAVQAANLIGRDVRLCVLGDGPERDRLRAFDLVGNVRFTGAVDRNEALAWMAASTAVIHASAQEAAPTVVREARMLRVPVVACDAGDVATWARADAGIHVVAPSARAIAAAVQSLRSARGQMQLDWQ